MGRRGRGRGVLGFRRLEGGSDLIRSFTGSLCDKHFQEYASKIYVVMAVNLANLNRRVGGVDGLGGWIVLGISEDLVAAAKHSFGG